MYVCVYTMCGCGCVCVGVCSARGERNGKRDNESGGSVGKEGWGLDRGQRKREMEQGKRGAVC